MSIEQNIPEVRFKGFSDKWKERNLNEITFKIGSGKTPKGGDASYVLEGIPLLRSQNIYNNSVNFRNVAHITPQTHADMKNSCVLKGDVLLNITGASIGRSAVYNSSAQANVNQHVCIIRLQKGFNSAFTQLHLASSRGQQLIDNNQAGGAREGLNFQQIGRMEFTFGAIEEQTKIGNYFQKLDTLINQHQQKHDKLSNLKKAMLEKMFPKVGESVPEIRFDGFSGDWGEKSLEEVCSLITKQTGFDYSATIKPSLVRTKGTETYPFVQNKDFTGSKVNLNTDFFIPKDVAEKFPRILTDVPSVLVSISGKIGNVGFYNLSEKSIVGGAVGICKLLSSSDGLVIVQQLLSNVGQAYFQTLTKSSSHANITVEDIRMIRVKLPPTEAEKIKVGNFFNQLDENIDQNEKQITKLKNIKQACLDKMFV